MAQLPQILQRQLSERTPRVFAPGELLASPARLETTVWYLHDGLVRLFSLAEDGSEHVHGFHGADEWVHGRLSSAALPDCCDAGALGLQALQTTRGTGFRLEELDEWGRNDPALAHYLLTKLMTMNAARLDREAALLTRSAEQRYLGLLAKQPQLLESVRLQDVAAWLGITPVALSRIRRRVRQREA